MIKKVLLLCVISFFSVDVQGQFNTILSKKKEEVPVVVQPLYGPCLYESVEEKAIDTMAIAVPTVANELNDEIITEVEDTVIAPIIGRTASYNEDEMFAFRQLVALPLDTCVVSSRFGERFHPFFQRLMKHEGIDLRADSSFVYSVMPGKVLRVSSSRRSGNYVVVEHGSYQSIYCHLEKSYVDKGDYVDAGQIVGLSGNTGMSTGPHLHFALKHQGKYINPEPFLNFVSALIGFVDFKLSQMPVD